MSTTWPQVQAILDDSGLVKRRSEALWELDIPIMQMTPSGPVDTGRWQNVFVEHLEPLGGLIRIYSFISFVSSSRETASGMPGPFTAEADALKIMEALSKLGLANIAYMNGDVWKQHTDKGVLMCLAIANSFPLSLLDASSEPNFGGYLMAVAQEADRLERILADQYGKKSAADAF